jgi:PAP2 superfamily
MKTLVLHARATRILLSLPIFMMLAGSPMAADELTKWNELATRLGFDLNPLFQSRILAMTHTAMHDAVNAIDRRYEPYSLRIPVTPGASPEAAAATAAYRVLLDQFNQQTAIFGFPSQQAELNAAYAASLGSILDGSAKTLGIGIGQAAAAVILSLRASDGAYSLPVVDPTYPQGTLPGQWRFTPGAPFAFEPQWGSVPPFVLDYSSKFRPNPPYPINSKRYTDDYNEVKALGSDGISAPSARTPDQTQIALFWLESSPVGWNRIARTVSATAGLNLWQSARLFALLNLAMADGYIASWDAKYKYNFWRPVTAIREGDADGNSETIGNPAWTPLDPTPPIPDHDSGHSVEGGAAAEALTKFFGSSRFTFQTCSTSVLPTALRCNGSSPVYRSFTSFSQAELENGLSRIYVGYHFRNAVIEGIEHGRKIADTAFQHFLRPAH